VERFQKHVWWVGGNALAYRPVLPAAFMMNSIPMVDVMAEVAKQAISPVSQTTYEEAFWTEGFTADGAGWGHGMQCLVWGYPIHGGKAALGILETLRGTPWSQQLERPNVGTLMEFVRGSSWYYHNGFIPPCLGRGNMVYDGFVPDVIPSLPLAEAVLKDWGDSLDAVEREELEQFLAEARENRTPTTGAYTGSRYFYNNDDLLVKSDDFYWFINMASVRCDGVESAADIAAGYNYYTCDGQTLFLRKGDEASRALGGFNLTAFPGVTARQGQERLNPITNWRGYCSKYNFAAGATRGGKNACAGLVFEKMNASAKKGVNDTVGLNENVPVIYGVQAYKSWFVFGDLMLALGAGVSNLDSQQEGDVWTTIDQTAWDSDVSANDATFAHDGLPHKHQLKSTGGLPWAKQEGGFAYAVLPDQTPGEAWLSAERRTSKWAKLAKPNETMKDIPPTTDVLQLWINHGREVSSDTYGYMVYAGQEDPARLFAESPVKVLSNTTNLQAACSPDGKVVEAVFFDATATLNAPGHKIKVSAPCALLVEFEPDAVQVTVTDAEMNVQLNEITVHIDGRDIRVPLPVEPHRGKPAHIVVTEARSADRGVDSGPLAAFEQAKFGMFIHWGLYAIPAGEWKGKPVTGIGEWIMSYEKIPVSEYEKLAAEFNPVKFNADDWAQLAQDAGMKYLVITSKHHDGFAMFDSKASEFNIVKATPYRQDPMVSLAKACQERDIKFGFYYSQAQDWHEPNAAGNDWDFPKERDPAPYVQGKMFPQVEEILSNYGDLALVWFDTPQLLNEAQVIELRQRVKARQPNCLVNSRIGHGQGDFDQMGDNSIPTQVKASEVWEVPATLNDTWGYKKYDQDWKDPRDLICKLADIVSKGGNYLLNVGPDAEGVIPPDSQRILQQIGRWIRVNGESIYGTSHSPFNVNGITWRCTAKPGRLYLHMINWPGAAFELQGLESRVTRARFLDGGADVPFVQTGNRLALELPAAAPDPFNTVILLQIADEQAVVTPEFRYDTEPAVRHLYAWEARLRGESFYYDWETRSAYNFVDGTRPRNELRWYNFPGEEAEYLVDIEYACDDANAGSPFVLSSRRIQWEEENTESSELQGVVAGTGGKFVTQRLGTLKLFAPQNTLIFGLREDYRSAAVKVRKLVLTRVQ
jgi:hypothetical protein